MYFLQNLFHLKKPTTGASDGNIREKHTRSLWGSLLSLLGGDFTHSVLHSCGRGASVKIAQMHKCTQTTGKTVEEEAEEEDEENKVIETLF